MHNWANPQKFENELSVPSDRHYEYLYSKINRMSKLHQTRHLVARTKTVHVKS